MNTRLILSACLAVTLSACYVDGPRAYTRGTYEDPNTIEMLSDQFNENDLQLIAKKMVNSLAGSPRFAQPGQQLPVVLVGRIKNKTSEHIDTESPVTTIASASARYPK